MPYSRCKADIEQTEHLICDSADSDTDGDGWGWENLSSCKVEEVVNETTYTTSNNTSTDNIEEESTPAATNSLVNCKAEQYNITPAYWENFDFKKLKAGDCVIFADGYYESNKRIDNVQGTSSNPIVFKAQNPGSYNAIIGNRTDDTDSASDAALRVRASSYLIFDGLRFQNKTNIDGEENYSNTARNELHEGLMLADSKAITIVNCLFDDIATRGIFISGLFLATNSVLVKNNLFHNIGDDTAGGAIGLGVGAANWEITQNLFATNVDGIVAHGALIGGNISENIFLGHKWENMIDIKDHNKTLGSIKESYITKNILYASENRFGSIEIQQSSQNIIIDDNIIYGGGQDGLGGILVKSRCGGSDCPPLENIRIRNNWLVGNGSKRGIRLTTNSHDPADLKSVDISSNHVFGYESWIDIVDTTQFMRSSSTDGWSYLVENNIFNGSTQIDQRVMGFTVVNGNRPLESALTESQLKNLLNREQLIYQSLKKIFPSSLLKNIYEKYEVE